MIETSVAFAAGILEGEGCFSKHVRKRTGIAYSAIPCEMTDKDVVYKLFNTFKVGSVCYRENIRKDGRNRKPSWIWSVQSKKDIIFVLEQIYNYMGERRLAKIDTIMKDLYDYFATKS